MKKIYIILSLLGCFAITALTSCDDMLDMGNDDVMYGDENHLTEGNDTVNSFVGILAQLQKIAVRTNLFGELRGDLVGVSNTAHADLKEIASFTVSDDNQYNAPRDYYAVINNCNYYLANADTALRESRYGANNRYDFYVFRAEWTAVRAIRAWVYLQLGQIYGQGIPLVTEPILSLNDADQALASAPKKDLAGLCSYFIDDLKPYVEWFAYPFHGNPSHSGYNSSTPSRLTVLPIQLVLGDLYLWRASITQNTTDARLAAQSYYDYIDWIPTDGGVTSDNGYKVRNTTGTNRCAWNETCFSNGEFSQQRASGNNNWFRTNSFGTSTSEVISVIAMDSASSLGHYNQLRKLYCYDMDQEDVEASIVPSTALLAYSDASVYFDYYTSGGDDKLATVTAGNLGEELVKKHFVGDLRFPTDYSELQRGDNSYKSQMISKCYTPQDVIIYRTGDIYLRLAEALNYAGFPKFALAILTTGLDNRVIQNEVLAYCTTAADSAFVQYFDFPTTYYQTRVVNYAQYTVRGLEFLTLPSTIYTANTTTVNQQGIHARGSGLGIRIAQVMARELYYPTSIDVPSDLTGYPTDPTNCTDEEFKAYAEQNGVVEPKEEDFPSYRDYLAAVEQYKTDYQAFYTQTRANYLAQCMTWYKDNGQQQVLTAQTAAVDSLLDAEQAMELCFEGQRFGCLMRAAYRQANPAYLAQRVAKRDASLLGLLSDPSNWFIRWNGQIGQ